MRSSARRALAAFPLVALLARPAPADPPSPRVETILVIPGSHLDVGFTDVPSEVRKKRIATLDAVIDEMQKDPDLRWTEEGGWVVHEWLAAHAKEPERIAKAKALVRAGRLGIGALYVNPHAALFPEGLHHLFAFHEEVEKAFGVRPKVAVINDVPSVPEALVDAAAEAGVEAFLCGANMAFSPPLPSYLTSGPFRWKSAKGNLVIVLIDPDSYTAAFSKWGIDPPIAKFMNRARFGSLEGMAVAESGIAEMSKGRSGTVVVEQAFDNWGPEAAFRLPAFAKAWNEAHPAGPAIRPAVPADALAAWKRMDLPVREGEWGGTWEEVRAGCPVTTANLRHASVRIDRDAPLAWRLGLAVAMDHSAGLGPGWPTMFTEGQTIEHAAEWASMLASATGGVDNPDLAALRACTPRFLGLNPDSMFPHAGSLPGIDAAALRPRLLRAGISLGGPYFPEHSPEIEGRAAVVEGIPSNPPEAAAWAFAARLDRAAIPGDENGIVDVGWDVPLVAKAAEVRAWPAGSASAAAGKWLRGEPPPTIIAPDGLVVDTPQGRLGFRSTVAFAYRVVDVAERAHVQTLLVRQTRLCTFKGGGKKALPFAQLYPGEPPLLDAVLEIQPLPRR